MPTKATLLEELGKELTKVELEGLLAAVKEAGDDDEPEAEPTVLEVGKFPDAPEDCVRFQANLELEPFFGLTGQGQEGACYEIDEVYLVYDDERKTYIIAADLRPVGVGFRKGPKHYRPQEDKSEEE